MRGCVKPSCHNSVMTCEALTPLCAKVSGLGHCCHLGPVVVIQVSRSGCGCSYDTSVGGQWIRPWLLEWI